LRNTESRSRRRWLARSQVLVDEALVMPDVEIGLGAVLGENTSPC
jgi:hypothetical protein